MKKMENKLVLLFTILISLVVFTGCTSVLDNKEEDNKNYAISFIDDSGNEININEPAKKIISLYSAHTENLFALGLDDEIIGVGTRDIYPAKALEKEKYDYKSDPEKVIAAEPDLVLIRPFIKRSKPEFVDALEKAGLTVVSLYPESFDEFDDYIKKLGIITGKRDKANKLLQDFYKQINEIKNTTKDISPKVNVYFESSENGYKTVTTDSMPAKAIEIAGGLNIALDAKPIKKGSSIAPYGAERILEKADKIDVFVSQNGVMNAGGNKHSITIRPGFDAIKAVQNDRVYVINQKIISSPTFRYLDGIKELCRMFYPEIFDDISKFSLDEEITRDKMAEIIVRFKNEGIFVPTSKYYRKKHKRHTYGLFKDVDMNNEYFHFIETAVTSGYMEGFKENNEEYFYPENKISREEFANILFMIGDLKKKENNISIKDLDKMKNTRIVQIVVDNKLMELEDGNFNPEKFVTGKEVVKSLEKLREITK
ncbi:ABC transporter substrate-binding protein [Tepidibacter formicigenes]|uniref:Iron complex transport system substrate-binding protein n=1 Tax=Tepidibacter formicigenes DSM 15518 TaxID=1123349 RepID=A0A1M6S7E2_9FIRM|nr:ABC transporter substrate-binding protein [Tepidibacter formicigenes]SHK40437.1 iron complex transport system substrate-binding protein [Tepidibacter formicigenes DSM 15518]